MKVSHTATIEVLASKPATDMRTQTPVLNKEGKQIFELAIKDEEVKTVAGQEFKSQIVSKLKSELDLKPGTHEVVLNQYAMSELNKKSVDLHYRVVSVFSTVKKSA